MKYCSLVLSGVVLLCATGCAQKRLFFATKTSIGLEVSGTAQFPDKVSFAVSRYEGAIVPRSTTGEPYSVYGGLDSDINWFGPKTIQQTFATGRAAQIAAGVQDVSKAPDPSKVSDKPLFFVTDTTFGLKISSGKQDVSPVLMLGYKRVEGTVIPVERNEREARSVYADIIINTASSTNGPLSDAFPNNNGVRVRQSFATGRAAEAIARRPDVKAKLDQAAVGFAAQKAVIEESNIARISRHVVVEGKLSKPRLAALAAGTAWAETVDQVFADGMSEQEFVSRMQAPSRRAMTDDLARRLPMGGDQ